MKLACANLKIPKRSTTNYLFENAVKVENT